MRIVLLGPDGQLGTDFAAACAARADIMLTRLPRANLDLTDLDAIPRVLGALDFDVLVNPTGYHRVDEVESHADLAFRVNAHAAEALALACARKGARMVHLSTDYVFGGPHAGKPLRETDPPSPLSVYGASKLAGESLVLLASPDALVCRVSALFGVAGLSGGGGNFVETMIRLAREKGRLQVVANQFVAPTATVDIAEALLRLLDRRAPGGIWHVAGTGHTSWHGFAVEILARCGLGDVPVDAVSSAERPTPARRPPWSVLDTAKLSAATGWTMPHWTDALDRYLRAKGHSVH